MKKYTPLPISAFNTNTSLIYTAFTLKFDWLLLQIALLHKTATLSLKYHFQKEYILSNTQNINVSKVTETEQ